MPSVIVSVVLVFMIAIVAIALVLSTGKPVIDAATMTGEVRAAETTLLFLDRALREAAREGNGSVRVFAFTAPKRFEIVPGEDAAVFVSTVDASLFEYRTRSQRDGFLFIGGDDVRCAEEDGNGDGTTDLVLENALLRAVFNRTVRAATYANITTDTLLLQVQEKTRGTTIRFENSSITIDSNASSSYGNGFSELLRTGRNLPFCTVHVFVNASAVDYHVYYRLYAGADFVTAEVRHVQ